MSHVWYFPAAKKKTNAADSDKGRARVPSQTHRVSFLRVLCLNDDTFCCVNATVMDELTLWPFLSSNLLAAGSRESEGKAR